MKIYKPKEEFQQSINFQGAYVELLKKLHKELSDKCKSGKGYQKAKNDVDLYELAVKLDAQIALLNEKVTHYKNIFIKSYDLELEECADQFEEVWAEALNYIDKNLEAHTKELKEQEEILFKTDALDESWAEEMEKVSVLHLRLEQTKKIKSTTEEFLSIDLKDKQHIEVKNVVYKDLKNLLKLAE